MLAYVNPPQRPTEVQSSDLGSSEDARALSEEGNLRSGFMRLSPELRNRIYRDTIPTLIRIYVAARVDREQVSLLQVCRSIRKETVPIFYGNTTFTFDLRNRENFQRAESWLNALSPEAVASLRKIYLNSTPSCCCKAAANDEQPTRSRAWVDLDASKWFVCGFDGCRHCTSQDRAKDVVCRIRDSCSTQTVRKEDIAELFEILRPIKAFEFSFEVARDGEGRAIFQDRAIRFGSSKAAPAPERQIKQPRSRHRNAGTRSSEIMLLSPEYQVTESAAASETKCDGNYETSSKGEEEIQESTPLNAFKDLDKKLRNALDDHDLDHVS